MLPQARNLRPCVALPARRRADSAFRPPMLTRRASIFRLAFSLVELTVVLALVVIVSAIALPRYWSSAGYYRVDLAARRLAADLALAQTHARTTAQFQNVRFSPK